MVYKERDQYAMTMGNNEVGRGHTVSTQAGDWKQGKLHWT